MGDGVVLDAARFDARLAREEGHVAVVSVLGDLHGREALEQGLEARGHRFVFAPGRWSRLAQPDVVLEVGVGVEQDVLDGGLVQQRRAAGIVDPHQQVGGGLLRPRERAGGVADDVASVSAGGGLAQKLFGAQVAVVGTDDDIGDGPCRPRR